MSRIIVAISLVSLVHWIVGATGIAAIDESELVRQLGPDHPAATRLQAIDAIKKLEKKAAISRIPDLAKCVNDQEHEVRVAAINAIVEIAIDSNLPCPRVFVDSLFHEDDDVRQLSASYIDVFKIIPEDFTPQLLKAMTHPDPNVRVHLAGPLQVAGSKDERTIPALSKAMNDKDLMVGYNASLAFYRATGDLAAVLPVWLKHADGLWEPLPPRDAPGKFEIVEKTPSVESIVGRAAGMAVQNIGREDTEKMGKALIERLGDIAPRMRRSAAHAIGLMAADSLKTREILEKLQARAALRKLRDTDDVKSVRNAAEDALGKFTVAIHPLKVSPQSDSK